MYYCILQRYTILFSALQYNIEHVATKINVSLKLSIYAHVALA